MSKEEAIKVEGMVIEVLPSAMFRIQVDNQDRIVLGVVSGRIRQNNIKILLGDRVSVEFSPYDLTRGRITRRL